MESIVEFLRFGLTGWSWPALVVFALAATHLTIVAVTVYLHRCQAHHALTLHPLVSHFFRFWLWLTTGMVTREWAAIHRKHHAKCETQDDPHSPQTRGISEVLWRGAELYRAAVLDREITERYGHGCPNDWVERHIYTRRSGWGVGVMLIADVLLFGVAGVAVWAVQMMWIPLLAAGVINGLGHYWGYRNFKSPDTSTNLVPWGILIGGEELHNNHHAHATSPKLSSRWYEFDIGWMYICIFSALGLAKTRALPPSLRVSPNKQVVDAETVRAVMSSKYELLARLQKLSSQAHRRLEQARLDQGRLQCELVRKALDLRHDFEAIWTQRGLSLEQAVAALQEWCQQAEASGIAAYRDFSHRLKTLTVLAPSAA